MSIVGAVDTALGLANVWHPTKPILTQPNRQLADTHLTLNSALGRRVATMLINASELDSRKVTNTGLPRVISGFIHPVSLLCSYSNNLTYRVPKINNCAIYKLVQIDNKRRYMSFLAHMFYFACIVDCERGLGCALGFVTCYPLPFILLACYHDNCL